MSYSSVLSISFHPVETDDFDRKKIRKIRRLKIFAVGFIGICVLLFIIGLTLAITLKETNEKHMDSTTKESIRFTVQISIRSELPSTIQSNLPRINSSTCQLPLYPSYNKVGRTMAGITDRSGAGFTHLNMPTCVYLNSKEELYVYDALNGRIVKYPSFNGVPERVLITGSLLVSVSNLIKMYIDHRTDDLYFLDIDTDLNYRVQHVTVDSSGFRTSVLLTGYRITYVDMDIDRNLNIYVSEFDNHRVVKWLSPDYKEYVVVAGNGTGGLESNQLVYPRGIYVDPMNNDLYTADTQRIQRWPVGSKSGQIIVVHGLLTPTVIRRDCHGNLYVLDGDIVKLFSSSSDVVGLEGVVLVGVPYAYQNQQRPFSTDYFYYPNDMYLNVENGDLYLADTGRHRIQRFTINGKLLM